MIKWLFGLIIKTHKPIKEQLADFDEHGHRRATQLNGHLMVQ